MPKPPKGLGPFGQLLQEIDRRNPTSFQLPADIRNYFRGIASANDGTYLNGDLVRQQKVTKQGYLEDRDAFRLRDKNGKLVLCYRCGGSALPAASMAEIGAGLNDAAKVDAALESGLASADPTEKEGTGWRKIVSCDFCALHWRIDCVDPPMIGMPSIHRKWMCPAHSDHVQPKRRIPRTGQAAPQNVDLPVPSGSNIGPGKHYRTRVLNNGDIDIIPDPLDHYFGPDGSGRSLGAGWDGIPGLTNGRPSTSGGSVLTTKYKYRVPEKVIRSDFWSKVGADDSSKIGDVFYVAAEALAGRRGARVILADDEDDGLPGSRYRPFGQRDYPRSGLDSLADIAIARLMSDSLIQDEHVEYVRPSRTRKLIETALQLELPGNDDVPESSLRASLTESETQPKRKRAAEEDALGGTSPLTDLSGDDEKESGPARRTLPRRSAAAAADAAIVSGKKARTSPEPAARSDSDERNQEPTPHGHAFEDLLATKYDSAFLSSQHEQQQRQVEQLRAVQELMKLKGPGKLLEFLLSDS